MHVSRLALCQALFAPDRHQLTGASLIDLTVCATSPSYALPSPVMTICTCWFAPSPWRCWIPQAKWLSRKDWQRSISSKWLRKQWRSVALPRKLPSRRLSVNKIMRSKPGAGRWRKCASIYFYKVPMRWANITRLADAMLSAKQAFCPLATIIGATGG